MAAQSSKEIVRKTITFGSPDRLAYDLPPDFGSDFEYCPMSPLPEGKPENGTDEWGVEWKNIGTSSFGQPQNIALNNWADLDKIDIPDIPS